MRVSLLGSFSLSLACVVAIGAGAAGASASAPAAVRPQGGPGRAARPAANPDCSTNAPASFVALKSAQDVAAAADSAVLGGSANVACGSGSAVLAGFLNKVGTTSGGSYSVIAGGQGNMANGFYSFLGAGYANTETSDYSFIGSGQLNGTNGPGSFVGAGGYEYAQNQNATGYSSYTLGTDAFIGGGDLNEVDANGGFIGGGGFTYAKSGATVPGNKVSGTDSFVGAGDQNTVAATEASIVGGQGNAVGSNATEAFVGGGTDNSATGAFATIPGGYHNVAAGTLSFAAGYGSDANTNGSFVWSDYSPGASHLVATVANQFLVRAGGGVAFFSDSTMKSGVKLAAGSGAWSSLSDRSMKTGVVTIDDARVLDKLATLPVSEWSYTTEPGVRHLGPMAQDFYAAFGVGEDDRHIASIDEDGVAFAAIKALHAENQRLRADNDGLRRRMARHDAAVEARLAILERALQVGGHTSR